MAIPTEPGLTEGQRRDKQTGLVQPWFTHPALDVVQAWDLRGKSVLEWGGGCSTAWWADRVGPTGRVTTIECSYYTDWLPRLQEMAAAYPQVTLHIMPIEDYQRAVDGEAWDLLLPGRPPQWDIVVVDGQPTHLRTNCLRSALLLPRPVTIICDNFMQDRVYDDKDAAVMMAPYPGEFHVQADHTDHDGHGWQTAIWHLR
jgi:predicted O-methyltransferase YrrM